MTETCHQLAEIIERNFGPLLDSHELRLIKTDGERLRCYQFFESRLFRLKVSLGPDEFNVEVGHADVPLVWDFKGDGERRWYFLREIRDFLNHDEEAKILTKEERLARTVQVQVNEQLHWLSENLDDIEDLFGRGGLEARMTEFEAFKVRRRLNAEAAMEAMGRKGDSGN